MGVVNNIVIGVLLISFFTFVAFFGRLPGLRYLSSCSLIKLVLANFGRRTPIGWLHRCMWIYIPNLLASIDKQITGGRTTRYASRSWNKLLYEKHPTILLFFFTLVTGGAILFLPASWQYMTWYHRTIVLILLPIPYVFGRLSNITTPDSPHVINHANINQQLAVYPYDYKLYHPNIMCRTCQLPKPARSKHCSLCRMCVARADHHCVWVNNCLGRGNYKYFIGLLASISILLFYGTYLAWITLKPDVQRHFQEQPEWHEMAFTDATDVLGRMLGFGEWALDILSTAFIVGGIYRGGVGFLMTLTSPLPFALLCYHIYLLWAGMTTNESGKWSDWKEDMQDGLCYVTDIDARASFRTIAGQDKGWDGYDTQVWKRSPWPKRSGQFLVVTGDGQYPRNLQPELQAVVGNADWRRCWKLKEVDNIYDLGFGDNVKYMLFN